MKKLTLMVVVLVLATLALAACGSITGAAAERTCPAPGEGTEQYTSEERGFCLLYPETYTVTEFEDAGVRIETEPVAFPHPMPPFASIETSDAADRSAEEIADEMTAEFQGPAADFIIDREVTSLNGVPAVMLDHVPGQDLSRQVLAVHDGKLYRLIFYTADEALPEYAATLELYETVIDSFTFTSSN